MKGSHSNRLTGLALTPGTVAPVDFSLSTIEVLRAGLNTCNPVVRWGKVSCRHRR